MHTGDMLGSGTRYVCRGVFRARPRRVGKKQGALAIVVALGAAGLAGATHRVVPGDNLIRLARRYGTTVSAIAQSNGIANVNLIRAGRLLHIPSRAPVRAGGPATGPGRQHRVASGENLTTIARKYGTTVGQLVAMNGIRNAGLIRAGQVLQVPGSSSLKVAGAPSPAVAQAAPPPVAAALSSVPVPLQPASLPSRPPTTTVTPAPPPGVEDLIELYSQKYGVQPALMKGLAWQESGWKQHVVSPAGAIGIMQVVPQTGEFIGRHLLRRPVDLNDRQQNVEAGIAFYAFYLSKTSGDERTAVAGYFQGLRSVWQNGISERTQRYVNSVLALRDRFAARPSP